MSHVILLIIITLQVAPIEQLLKYISIVSSIVSVLVLELIRWTIIRLISPINFFLVSIACVLFSSIRCLISIALSILILREKRAPKWFLIYSTVPVNSHLVKPVDTASL